jgi:hypothetical protein
VIFPPLATARLAAARSMPAGVLGTCRNAPISMTGNERLLCAVVARPLGDGANVLLCEMPRAAGTECDETTMRLIPRETFWACVSSPRASSFDRQTDRVFGVTLRFRNF